MHINLSPQVRDGTLAMSRHGDKLTINGQVFDFTPLPDGAVLPAAAVACEFIQSDVTRMAGQIVMTMILPIAWNAPHEACFPVPIVDPVDGPIPLPAPAPIADPDGDANDD